MVGPISVVVHSGSVGVIEELPRGTEMKTEKVGREVKLFNFKRV